MLGWLFMIIYGVKIANTFKTTFVTLFKIEI
jgi:hypothetical protein